MAHRNKAKCKENFFSRTINNTRQDYYLKMEIGVESRKQIGRATFKTNSLILEFVANVTESRMILSDNSPTALLRLRYT